MSELRIYSLLLLLAAFSSPLVAQTIYTDRASFVAANPGLVLEDFENALRVGVRCSAPLSSTTSGNPCFAPGGLVAGVEYSLPANPAGQFLATAGPTGVVDSTLSKRLGADNVADTLVMTMTAANVTAVGMDLTCGTRSFDIGVKVFGVDGLINDTLVSCSNESVFFAISTSETIIRVEAGTSARYSFMDNLLFGAGDMIFANGFE